MTRSLDILKHVMSSIKKHDSVDTSWRQLEDFVDKLHELAQEPLEAQAFYRQLLEGCVGSLAATGGAVWLPAAGGRWTQVHQINREQVFACEAASVESAEAGHYALLQAAAAASGPQIYPPRSGDQQTLENPTDSTLVLAAVHSEESASATKPEAIVELYLRSGSSPAVQQGWQELLSTVCQIAASFHTFDQLRTLRSERGLHHQALALLRRIHGATDLQQTVFEIANEGRRFLDADRLSVLLRQGNSWRLLAVSGVERIEKRGDTTKRLQQLADKTACWGEPIDYGKAKTGEDSWETVQELPPELMQLVEGHVDQSHARRLVAVPVEYVEDLSERPTRQVPSKRYSAVLIAEQFSAVSSEFSCQRVVELAGLCEPALRQATRLDRFPMRTMVRWSHRLSLLNDSWKLLKLTLLGLAVAAIVAALVYLPYDFEIEAPATLVPIVERDVFASADGTVTDVRVAHGDQVQPGEVLARVEDAQLSLDVQRVLGEIETVRKRMEAIAVARTGRLAREDSSGQGLPLAAETKQLEERLASLRRQQEILAARREALTLRSPIAGTVLTLDVQNLLESRPVKRGQVLFTVADSSAGWRLLADVSQDRIGHVVAAAKEIGGELPVRFRLAGDVTGIYRGHVESVSATAVLDTENLYEEPPTVRVRVAVDEPALPSARPGMSAQARIHCGQRSLGYVWLHETWETVYSWLVF